jgi:hypothetical protein
VKLIKEVPPRCPCTTKLWDFYAATFDEAGQSPWGVGTVVECDCGTHYALAESQFDGKFWQKVGRDAVKIGMA